MFVRDFLLNSRLLLFVASAAALAPLVRGAEPVPPKPPNIIVILTDDQGYGDLGCYGSKTIRTPHLDQMAAQGMRFTACYGQPICTAARAALMTGSYPMRCGLPDVHSYGSPFGLNLDEVTIAETLKSKGYATACVGKWHLGDSVELGPNRQGFDYFYGNRLVNGTQAFENFAVPLWRNERLLTTRPEHSRFTVDFHREAMQFIEEHRDGPFFVYLAHFMPHVPTYPGDGFRRRSGQGLYTDAVEEIDFYVGRLLARLKELHLDETTLVIFTSDNGPWKGQGEQSGSAGPLRGSKLATWEGGMRQPFIARWPGHIPAGVVNNEVVTHMDFLPTFAKLTGAQLSPRVIDGRDITPLLTGKPNAKSPHEFVYYYAGSWLQAVRDGRWKLHLARPKQLPAIYGWCANWFVTNTTLMESDQLYDLDADIGETTDVAAQHRDVVARLSEAAAKARKEIGDYGKTGTGSRPMGSSLPEYPDCVKWQKSPDNRRVTAAMVAEMRAFQHERQRLLFARPPQDRQEKEEWAYYEKLFGSNSLNNPD